MAGKLITEKFGLGRKEISRYLVLFYRRGYLHHFTLHERVNFIQMQRQGL